MRLGEKMKAETIRELASLATSYLEGSTEKKKQILARFSGLKQENEFLETILRRIQLQNTILNFLEQIKKGEKARPSEKTEEVKKQ